MNVPNEYQQLEIKRHTPTTPYNLNSIPDDIPAVDVRAKFVEMAVDGSSAAPDFSESQTFSLEVPGLKAGDTQVKRIHGMLPDHVELHGEVLAVANDDGAGGASSVLSGSAFNTAIKGPDEPIVLPHDPSLETAGLLRLELQKTNSDVIPAYHYAQDQGNAGVVVFQLDTPYSVAGQTLSGRAAETALESVLSGPTQVLLRPVSHTSSNPEPWRMVGCLQPSVEEQYNYEYAEVMKGFKANRAAKQITQQLMDFNCNSTGDTLYLRKLLEAGLYEDNGYVKKIKSSFSSKLPQFEVILQSRTVDGLVKYTRIPRATLQHNGNITHGGNEFTIPFKVEGMESAEIWYTHHLYQTTFLTVGVIVTS